MATVVTLFLLLTGIAAIAAAFLTSRSFNRDMEDRLNLVAGPPATGVSKSPTIKAPQTPSRIDSVLRGFFSIGMKQRWPIQSSGLSLLALAAMPAVGLWLIARVLPGMPSWIAFALGTAAFFLVPNMLLRMDQASIDRQFIELFPSAIDMIVRMLRAGLPVTATIRTVANEAPSPVSLVFADLANQMDIGITFEDALASAASRLGLGDFRYFTVAASLQRATGGNLAATLDIMSDIIRKKRAGRLKAKAVTAEARMTAFVLGCIPIFIIFMLAVVKPDYLLPLINDPRGNVISGIAAGLLVLAFVIIRQMMRGVTRLQ